MPRPARLLPVLLGAVILLPGALHAQASGDADGRRFRFSMGAGAAFSKFTGADADTASLDWRVGFAGSGSVAYEVSPRFALAFEGGVLQMGAKQLEVSRDPGLGYNLTYLELGLSAEFNLAPGGTIQPVLHAGPTFGIELDCKQPIVYNQTAVLESNCLNQPERESSEPGFQVGIGLRWKMLVLDGRYERAFKSVIPSGDLTNQGFILTAGVRY